jgi:hypothetical protein
MKIKKESKGTPILNYCRKLIEEGNSPEDQLHAFRDNNPDPDIIVTHIGKVSQIAVAETQWQGPRFVKYTKMDSDALKRIKLTRERTAA